MVIIKLIWCIHSPFMSHLIGIHSQLGHLVSSFISTLKGSLVIPRWDHWFIMSLSMENSDGDLRTSQIICLPPASNSDRYTEYLSFANYHAYSSACMHSLWTVLSWVWCCVALPPNSPRLLDILFPSSCSSQSLSNWITFLALLRHLPQPFLIPM